MTLPLTLSLSLSEEELDLASGKQTHEIYWARLRPCRSQDRCHGEFRLKDDKVYVGRDANQCQVSFNDTSAREDERPLSVGTVSRIHLQIERLPAAQCAKVTNLSTGRTWIDGKPLPKNKATFVSSSAIIALGVALDKNGHKLSAFAVKYKLVFGTGDAVSVLKEGEYMLKDSEQLGVGSFGEVFAGQSVAKGRVAIKRINKKRWRKKTFMHLPSDALHREGEIMKKLEHEHIAKVFDVWDTDEHMYISMRFAAGGTLQTRLGQWQNASAKNQVATRIAVDNCRDIMWQVIDVLLHMHSKGIAHRDLKPENILFLDEGYRVLVVDFGLAKMLNVENSEYLKTVCGTTPFNAPEVQRCIRHGLGVDYWSLGVVLYVMLAGHSPYETAANRRDFQVSFPDTTWRKQKKALRLVQQLLDANPKTRYGYEQVASDEWMNAGPKHRLNKLTNALTEVSATIGESIGKLELSTLPRTQLITRKSRKRRRAETENSDKENAAPNEWENAAFERPKKKRRSRAWQ